MDPLNQPISFTSIDTTLGANAASNAIDVVSPTVSEPEYYSPEPEEEKAYEPIPNYYFSIGECYINNPITDNSTDDLFVTFEICVSKSTGKTKLSKKVKFSKAALINQADAKEDFLMNTAAIAESKEEVKEPTSKSAHQRMLELAGVDHPLNYVAKR